MVQAGDRPNVETYLSGIHQQQGLVSVDISITIVCEIRVLRVVITYISYISYISTKLLN